MNLNPVLVTGASGFTGSYVVRELAANGYSVRAMVRSEDQASKLRQDGIEVVRADLTDQNSLREAVRGAGSIVHIAALFRRAGLPEEEFRRVNLQGTRMLMDLAIESGVRRFVHCSTVGVLGDVAEIPADENTPLNPGDMYQRSKADAEDLVMSYFKSGKLNGVVIRPAMIYGPGDQRILKLFKMISERSFFYVGSGQALVHFIDVRDLARAFRLALEQSHLTANIYIIAGSQSLPLKDAVAKIATILNVAEPKIHLPVRPVQLLGSLCELICTPLRINPPIFRRRVDFFTKNRAFDCSKAALELGFKPHSSFDEELIDIINSYIESGLIKAEKLNSYCTFRRELDGRITKWEEGAQRVYGFEPEQALGNISHKLLNTKFPRPLEHINSELTKSRAWTGNLVHLGRNGERLSVLSQWRVEEGAGSGGLTVVETNRLREMDAGERPLKAAMLNPAWFTAGSLGHSLEMLA
ncbi:MAG: hypothetical protein DCC75_02415 [Proteobacteria bacterium]|nr:MAG: hypothetical protein DCC75_02415 [Pseudomonadota bacterium]